MFLLAIDTAGPDCSVGVARASADGLTVLASDSERIGRGHAERLMPMIESTLARANIAFSDLDRIAVTTGPGSFTGIRVGVAAARGLALALDIPSVGVGSLEALLHPVAKSRRDGTAIAVLDAKRGEVYALAHDLASHSIIIEASALPVEALAAKVGAARSPFFLVGAGAPLVGPALPSGRFEIVATPEAPDIADVAELGSRITKLAPPVPHYARDADAKPQADKAIARS